MAWSREQESRELRAKGKEGVGCLVLGVRKQRAKHEARRARSLSGFALTADI